MTEMKSLLTVFAVGLLCIGASACGGAGNGASSTSHVSSAAAVTTTEAATTTAYNTASPQDYTKVDGDRDNDVGAPDDDRNHSKLLRISHAANASDTRTIESLIKRYYAAVAAADGAKACAMLYSTISESVPEDYGMSPPGPPYARGTTCPAVLTLLFKHFHRQAAAEYAKLRVTHLRLQEHHGFAVLSFGALPEREIQVAREGHIWRITSVLDKELY